MIYGLIEWRRVGNWRKCIQDCERAKRASQFFKYLRWKHTILLKSQYTLLINHCLSVQDVHDCVRNTRDMVLFIILTRKQETWETWYRASGESEPKLLYFCVGKMFYIPTRNSKKSYYKWLRASQFFCVCLKHAILLNILLVNHILSVQCVLMFVTLVIILWSCLWRFIPTRNFPETREKPINGCERAERTSRSFYTFESETYISSDTMR